MSTWTLRKAWRLAAKGRWEAACEYLRQARSSEQDPRLSIQEAVILLDAGQSEAAVAVLEQLVQQQPHNVPALLFLGIAALDAKLPEKARVVLSQAVELAPGNDLAYGYLALALLRDGDYLEGARKLIGAGLPDNRGFLVRLTEWAENEWLTAGRFFAPQPLEIPPTAEIPAWRRRRQALRAFYRKHYSDVVATLWPLIQNGQADAGDLYGCAFSCEMLGAYQEALELLGSLRGPDAECDPVLALKGRCLIRLGRYEEAMGCLERVLIVGPEDFGLNYYLGVLCLAHNESQRARDFFSRAYRDYFIDTQDYQLWRIRRGLESLLLREASLAR